MGFSDFSVRKMARLWLLCTNFCVVFLLISDKTGAQTLQDTDIYKYITDPVADKNSQLTFVEYDDTVHSLWKRDATTASPPPETNKSNGKMQTEKKAIPVETKTLLPSNVVLLDKHAKHNLGENGTGIRKTEIINTSNTPIVTEKPANETSVDSATTTATTTTTMPTTTTTTSTTTTVQSIGDTVAKNNQTGGDDSEISISKFAEEEKLLNKTLSEKNITTSQDTHLYYNSSFTIDKSVGHQFWINMTNRTDVKVNELLSQSHRRAATVKLSFDFPFYGHTVRNVTIATGGFLYTGEYVHSWLAATQYIAPLMANFDTSLSNESFVKYVDNGTAFTVQWEKVVLQDKPNEGNFTFQATLHKNGDIVFVYQHVPVVIENIKDVHHPVKVGLSDAYIIDRTIFFVRRKTIYEYHRVNFRREDIRNWTVIYLNALPTCLNMKDCNSCLTKLSDFQCAWCPASNRCSNGMDRHRQDWLLKNCDVSQVFNVTKCPEPSSIPPYTTTAEHDHEENLHHHGLMNASQASRVAIDEHRPVSHAEKQVHMGLSGIIGIMFVIGLVAGLGVWVLYAYRNPHSTSGQMLIRYRPSQWSWKRGEARYTAATIHM